MTSNSSILILFSFTNYSINKVQTFIPYSTLMIIFVIQPKYEHLLKDVILLLFCHIRLYARLYVFVLLQFLAFFHMIHIIVDQYFEISMPISGIRRAHDCLFFWLYSWQSLDSQTGFSASACDCDMWKQNAKQKSFQYS